MGSGSSNGCLPTCFGRRRRSKSIRNRLFRYACFGPPNISSDAKDEQQHNNCKSGDRLKFANPEEPLSNQETAPQPTATHSRSDGLISFRFGRASSLGSSNILSHDFPSRDHNVIVDAKSSQDVVGMEAAAGLHNFVSNVEASRAASAPRRLPQESSSQGTAQFSRTRSVGRLRDRVLRSRTSLLDGRTSLLDAYVHHGSARRYLSDVANVSSEGGGSMNNLALRETSTQETLDHRSTFLDRRRRIRSQIRALERLGGQFENISGHDRSCFLSGQHRTGNCSCRRNTPSTDPRRGTNNRASSSISRIVMLAEALFEVLDEIHQQAVVLASRPSLSLSLIGGSTPAPKEVVDCMPVKTYMKSQKQQSADAATQCYICLVEYEDGDSMRILPCHHEFHRICVDKWLKEVHRVCPLCRGDVCTSSFG